MKRKVVATPLFAQRLQEFLDEYAALGAVRFVDRLHSSYREMLDNIADFNHIAPARRRTIKGKKITVREYVLEAGARDFFVLYFVSEQEHDPIVLLNIKINGQNRFRWR